MERNTSTDDEAVDLNRRAGGAYIYTYVTRDTRYGAPLTDIQINENQQTPSGYVTATDTAGTIVNLNKDCGSASAYIYLHYQRFSGRVEILVHFLDSNGTRTSQACFANASNHLQLVTINPHAPQSVTYNGNTYTFLGWSTDSGATEADYVAGDTISLTGDATLYAVYREEHGTISYVDKAAPYDPYPVFSGDTVYRLSNGKGVTLGYSNDENKVIFSMDIAWGELVFTYTDEAGWDNPETNCVTVENTGNGQFTVTYAYVTDRTDITGSLRDEAGDPVTQLVLASGEEVTVRLLLEGEPAKVLENTKIGSLKLTIE